jgi:SDR family mycofactocin-dependent oxidoreductase
MTGRLAGKVAFITGAARGQGRAEAVRFAEEGADVIAVDLCAPVRGVRYPAATREDLDETARLVEALDRRVVATVADTRDPDALRAAVDRGVETLGRLDVVVANAGICIMAPWDRVTPEIFADTVQVNLVGTWNTVMATAPVLQANGGGSIILTSSVAGLKALPFLVPYVASKHGVTGLARAFAHELAKDGIRVNSVHPTGVDTPMASNGASDAAMAIGAAENPRLMPMFTNSIEIDKVTAQDIANAVVFLAGDESRHVTGLALTVDAGNSQY